MDWLVSKSNTAKEIKLSPGEINSLIYHDIFDFPLTQSELVKWESLFPTSYKSPAIGHAKGFYFLKGREAIVYKRLLRKKISERKLRIVKQAGRFLSFIPTIKMVAVTGALAMGNASSDSDIDLMIITKKGSLWTTRLICLIGLIGQVRRFGDKSQKDKLCLNMWLAENSLVWPKKDRNIYTAHEIAQIVPVINKDRAYEKFLWRNRWVQEFWQNSIQVKKLNIKNQNHSPKFKIFNFNLSVYFLNFALLFIEIIEKVAFSLQFIYMRRKITREIVTPTRAIFHPNDWGKVVLSRLGLL
jgi:predicted nucleotidyltransferase